MSPPSPVALEPLDHQIAPLREMIIRSLRRAVERGILGPGQRLVEKDLCAQLGVSRTSLREALRELQAEGVLTYMSNRGLTVAGVSRRDAENIYRIRAALEPLIVEQFIENADAGDIEALGRDAEEVIAAFRGDDVVAIIESKRQLYDRICKGAMNPVAFEILHRLTLRTSQLRRRAVVRPERRVQSISEIEALVAAIARRDVPAARAAAERHVLNAAASALSTVGAD
ncbi:MAG TPA: GntR family transcriptional regulator [Geminicoccaceae bacterium]